MNTKVIYRGTPSVARKAEGYPFSPLVNIMAVKVSKSLFKHEKDLLNTKYVCEVGIARYIRGPDAYDKFIRLMRDLVPTLDIADNTRVRLYRAKNGFEMQVATDLSDYCIQGVLRNWYPLAFEVQDTYVIVYELPIFPIDINPIRHR